jgi:hypothetical protein
MPRAQPAPPGVPHATGRRRSAAWQALLIYGVLAAVFGAGAVSGQEPTPPAAPPPVEEPAPEECTNREAVAASIAKLQSSRAPDTPFEELLRQMAEIEKHMLELKLGTGAACGEALSIIGLSERFDPIREELTRERRRREISRKAWPEHIKLAVLENRVELGMTREQVTAAWGDPRNVDVTPTTRQEQWTYSGPTYLLFTDGALATIARTRRPRD